MVRKMGLDVGNGIFRWKIGVGCRIKKCRVSCGNLGNPGGRVGLEVEGGRSGSGSGNHWSPNPSSMVWMFFLASLRGQAPRISLLECFSEFCLIPV